MQTLNLQINDNIGKEKLDEFQDLLQEQSFVVNVGFVADRSKVDRYIVSVSINDNLEKTLEISAKEVGDSLLSLIIPCDDGDYIYNKKLVSDDVPAIFDEIQQKNCI